MRIAIDAMGGDNAPSTIVDGVALAVKRNPSIKPVLVGAEVQLKPLIKRHTYLASAKIVNADDVVAPDEKPSVALRMGKSSSMQLAINLVKDGQADATVSAGNSGALMVMALVSLRPMEGIDRPALAAFMPTLKGRCCMLDLGANIDCTSDHLVQFAIMGDAFCRVTSGIASPSIGLLNVGEEEQKGNATIQQAATILSNPDVKLNYNGFVEGNAITKGMVDVLVSDGFSGNIALKTIEGTAQFISTMLRRSFKSSFLAKFGYFMARPALKALRESLNPQNYNGAVLLGLNGIVVKSHGGADAVGIANAIDVAANMISNSFIDDLKKSVERTVVSVSSVSAEKED
jgi:glycerol-3-phosphate acyltransferase PlsX